MKQKDVFLSLLFACAMLSATAQERIGSFEYWIDDDVNNKTVVVGPTAAIDLSLLPQGMHSLSYRFNDNGLYSPTMYKNFFVMSHVDPSNQLVSCEYWIDGDFAHKTTFNGPTASIDVSQLPLGIHSFSYRFKDAVGRWSPIMYKNFFVVNHVDPSNQLVSCEYWIDGDFAHKTTFNGPTASIDVSQLPLGIHSFSYRFKDAVGRWSPIMYKNFFVVNHVDPSNQLVSCEYWIDGNSGEVNSVNISNDALAFEIDGSDLEPGIHFVYYRIKDVHGFISPTICCMFIAGTMPNTYPLITGYAYWFNNGPRYMVDVEPTATLHIDNEIIDVKDKIEPNSIAPNYTIDVDEMKLYTFDDVLVSMRVYNEDGNGSAVVVDTINQLMLRVPLHATKLLSGICVTDSTPTGGKVLCYEFDCNEGDHVALEVSGSGTVDLFDDNGLRITPDGKSNQISLDVANRVISFTSQTKHVIVVVYGGNTMDEETSLMLNLPTKGDIDGNDLVDMGDINIIINIMLGKVAQNEYNADIDGNGVVDMGDVNLLINISLGKQ